MAVSQTTPMARIKISRLFMPCTIAQPRCCRCNTRFVPVGARSCPFSADSRPRGLFFRKRGSGLTCSLRLGTAQLLPMKYCVRSAFNYNFNFKNQLCRIGTMRIEYFRSPTPHAFIPQLIAPELYSQIRFPDIPPRPMGRIGRDIYFGEPEWPEIMAQPGWTEFSSTFMSEAFMRRLMEMFADDIRTHGCGIDPDKVYLAQRSESRVETETPSLSETDDPHALFIRFDLQAIDATYNKKSPLRSSSSSDWRSAIFELRRR